jgi:hypothetical protein
MKSLDGRDAENILFGSTLSNDRHAGRHFDYLITNSPYGPSVPERRGIPAAVGGPNTVHRPGLTGYQRRQTG